MTSGIRWPYFCGGPLEGFPVPWETSPPPVLTGLESTSDHWLFPDYTEVLYQRDTCAFAGSAIAVTAYAVKGEPQRIWESVICYALLDLV